MGLKSLAVFAVLVAVALAPTAVAANSSDQSGANRPSTSLSPLSPPSLTTPHGAANSIRSAPSPSRAASSVQGAANTAQ